jgi:hypothetical protein
LTEAIVEVLGESTPFVLLSDDEPAKQSLPRRFGLPAIRDLRRQQGPRFRELASDLCRRRRVATGVLCQARVAGDVLSPLISHGPVSIGWFAE